MIDDNSPLFICRNCVIDNRLKLLIENQNTTNTCTCCGEKNLTIDVFSNEFEKMIKALIRYYYSEWDYNTHFGGNGLCKIFEDSKKLFFDKSRFIEMDVFDELIAILDSAPVYEDYDKGISLFSGYDSIGQQNILLESIKTNLDPTIIDIEKRLIDENYFLLESEMNSILSVYKDNCLQIIKCNTTYYRCRIGYEKKIRADLQGWELELVYIPFSNSKIGAPPPYLTQVGRLNRHGVSFFYCATDQYTAMSEIRPHPGDIVSVGKFKLKKDVQIFDLSDRQFLNFYLSDEKLDEYMKLNTLSELMHKTVPPTQRERYSITQLIADCVRQLGFDGILFNSSVSLGYNMVLFDPNNIGYINEEAGVLEIEEVTYRYKNKKIIDDTTEIKEFPW